MMGRGGGEVRSRGQKGREGGGSVGWGGRGGWVCNRGQEMGETRARVGEMERRESRRENVEEEGGRGKEGGEKGVEGVGERAVKEATGGGGNRGIRGTGGVTREGKRRGRREREREWWQAEKNRGGR